MTERGGFIFNLAYLIAIVAAVAAAGCASSRHQVAPPDEVKMFDANYLSSGLKRIAIGDSREHVISVLGPPTMERVLMAKENQTIKARFLRYYVYREDPRLVNEKKDIHATIYLDDDGKVIKILKHNLD